MAIGHLRAHAPLAERLILLVSTGSDREQVLGKRCDLSRYSPPIANAHTLALFNLLPLNTDNDYKVFKNAWKAVKLQGAGACAWPFGIFSRSARDNKNGMKRVTLQNLKDELKTKGIVELCK
ncbi:hypothetical protein Trydic_g22446 [Trypoxylus dichotomus]